LLHVHLTPRCKTSVDFLTRYGHKPPAIACNRLEAAILDCSFPVIFRIAYKILSIHGGRVANALGCNARGDGFVPRPRRYFLDLFSRIDLVSGTEGHKMVCVTLWNLLRPAMSAVLTGK